MYPVPSRINALKPYSLNTKQGSDSRLQCHCAEQIACGHSPHCSPIAYHRNDPPPHPQRSPRATMELFNSSPSRRLLPLRAACRVSLCKQRSPHSHAKFMTAARHKRRARSSSVSRRRYRFSNPTVLHPQILFVCVTEEERKNRGRGRLKRFPPTCVYFHPALQSKRVSVLLQLKEGAGSQAQLGCV